MNYKLPNTLVLSYLGGTFGNALASAIISSRSEIIKYPIYNTFHVNPWPIDSNDCMITEDSIVRFNREVVSGDIIQLHCLNANLIYNKFPDSKHILLDCDTSEMYYGIQRQWLVNTNLIELNVNNVLSAWNWIDYNIKYYKLSGIYTEHPNVLCLNFKLVEENFDLIENYIGTAIVPKARDIYCTHYQKQMKLFYDQNLNFKFAWDIFNNNGPDAPIADLAKEYVQ